MSLFANVDLEQVKTGTTQKQPVCPHHQPLTSYQNEEFSFRTISSDFNVGGVDYKISCFQMRAGFYDRNTNIEGALKFAQMINHVEVALNETELVKSFGLDCSTFKQDQGDKNASRNLYIYIMPRLPNGVVRSYIDALTQDIVKKQASNTVANTPAKPANGWAALKQPQAQPVTTSTPWEKG